ncbi:MAG TPA: hypothetical protein VNN07_03820 [Candidatus Tectomicrobia bacterium]|nr:hypothetical protein [Candidatus Tectomicrobia bacterium]
MRHRRTASLTARCDHCRKVLRAGRSIEGPGGTQFDSLACRKAHASTAELKRLQNGLRVARSRLKTAAIARAGTSYRTLGGRDWALVEQVLRSLL